MRKYIKTFQQIAERENGNFLYTDDGPSARIPHAVLFVKFKYKEALISIKNTVGTEFSGNALCKIPLGKRIGNFEITTREPLFRMIYKKDQIFKFKYLDPKTKYLLHQNLKLKELEAIASKIEFIPSFEGTSNTKSYVLKINYALMFDDWDQVIEPIIDFYKSFYDQIQENVRVPKKHDKRYPDAEIQAMDLLHLVKTGNKEVFAEMIAYSGPDSTRNFKTHLDLGFDKENETNNLYYHELQRIISQCYHLKPPTGNIDNDFSFVITNSKKKQDGDLEMIRVDMNYCLPDEKACIDQTFHLDFISGEKEYLLIDINNKALYKTH